MTTLTYTGQLSVFDCCNCGITFAIPKRFEELRRDDHERFYCPRGHGQSFLAENAEDKAKKRVVELERRIASREEDLRAVRMQRDDVRRSLSATKGVLTKTRKRAEKGVCLHCHRYFVDVARHVAGQHGELVSR